MLTRLPRVLPSLLIAAVLIEASLSASRHASAQKPAAVPATLYYPDCSFPVQQGAGSAPIYLAPGQGVTQPIGVFANFAACSLRMDSPGYDGTARLRIVEWDPVKLAPEPTRVALRSQGYQNSELMWNHLFQNFLPPLVVRAVSNVAEPPGNTLALDFQATDDSHSQMLYFDSGAPASVPKAYRYAGSGPRELLPGEHPVMTHTLCGGDAALQNLQVVQSVMTTDVLYDTTYDAVYQRFRVPVQTTLRWVELAFDWRGYRASLYGYGHLAIIDGNSSGLPPAESSPLVAADFVTRYLSYPGWASHFDFDHVITLQPRHDYWLFVQGHHTHSIYARNLTGLEPPAFTSAIGPLYARVDVTDPWTLQGGHALDFRVIGEPQGTLGAPPPATPGARLVLSAQPNPSRGGVMLAWSGASGGLRFEVLDARGRRVGGGEGASAEGRWMWSAVRPDGRPLPGGVYFVRATDDAGQRATERVVLVR